MRTKYVNKKTLLAYDRACKEMLSHTDLVAYLVKAFVPDYKDLSIKKIGGLFINTTRDKTILNSLGTEYHTRSGKRLTMDLVFGIKSKDKKHNNTIIIGIEAQSIVGLPYPLENRVYEYLDTLSYYHGNNNDNYRSINDIYAFWICGSEGNNSESYVKVTSLKSTSYKHSGIEKLNTNGHRNIIEIYLGKDSKDNKYQDIIYLLKTSIGRNDLDLNEIVDTLKTSYNINIREEKAEKMISIAKDVFDYKARLIMEEGYQDGFEKGMEDGIQKGMKKGLEKGIEKGIIQNATANIKSLMSSLNLNFEQAAKTLNIDKTLLKEIKKEIEKKNK